MAHNKTDEPVPDHTRNDGSAICRPLSDKPDGTTHAWSTTGRHRPERRPTLSVRPATPASHPSTVAKTSTVGWQHILFGVLLIAAGVAFAMGVYFYADNAILDGACTTFVTPAPIPNPPPMGP